MATFCSENPDSRQCQEGRPDGPPPPGEGDFRGNSVSEIFSEIVVFGIKQDPKLLAQANFVFLAMPTFLAFIHIYKGYRWRNVTLTNNSWYEDWFDLADVLGGTGAWQLANKYQDSGRVFLFFFAAMLQGLGMNMVYADANLWYWTKVLPWVLGGFEIVY